MTARKYVTPRCHCYASGPAAAPSSRSFVSAFILLLTYSGSLLGDMSVSLLLRDLTTFSWTCYAALTRTLLLTMCPPSNESSDATSPRSSERSRRKPTGLTKFGRTWARMNDWRCRSSFSSCALDGCSIPPSDGRQHVKQDDFATRHPSFEALLGLVRPSLTSPATRLSTDHMRKYSTVQHIPPPR